MANEEENTKAFCDGILSILSQSQNFDMETYRKEIEKEHERVMASYGDGEIEWSTNNPMLDIHSEQFDPQKFIESEMVRAREMSELRMFLDTIQKILLGQTQEKTPTQQRDLARQQGAIMTINNRLAFPSEAKLIAAFTSLHIWRLPSGMPKQDVFDSTENIRFEDVARIDSAMLGFVYKLALQKYAMSEGEEIAFPVSIMCRQLGIDPREFSTKRDNANKIDVHRARFEKLAARLRPFEDFFFRIADEDDTYYRVLVIESYNPRTDVCTCRSPALFRLIDNQVATTVRHSRINEYFHATLATEQNTAAVELAIYLANTILIRGSWSKEKSDTKFLHFRYTTLIQNCPQFKAELTEILNKPSVEGKPDRKTRAYNDKLKDILTTAYRIILEKTDIPKQFIDFKINGVSTWSDKTVKGRRIPSKHFRVPTKTRIGDLLVISHKGRNKTYVRPKSLQE